MKTLARGHVALWIGGALIAFACSSSNDQKVVRGDGDGDSPGGSPGDGDGDETPGDGDGDGDEPTGTGGESSASGGAGMGGDPKGQGGEGSTEPTYNIAFLSPEAVSGDLGGVDGADALCAGWAADAKLGGNFVAVLSTSSLHASARLDGARGWVRPDGVPVADEPAQLFANELLAPIRLAPDGADLGAVPTWSGSNHLGEYTSVADSSACDDWTSGSDQEKAAHGLADTTANWLYRGGIHFCDTPMHLFCLQTDYNEPLDADDYAEEGRLMFVSTQSFQLDQGIDGADKLCADDAEKVLGRSERFSAFIAGYDDGSSSYFSAASRFEADERPLVRVDGLRIANDFKSMLSEHLIHPPSLDASGELYTWRVIVGANGPDSVPTESSSCKGWSELSETNSPDQGMASGTVSGPPSERSWFGYFPSGSCLARSDQMPVYCLEL